MKDVSRDIFIAGACILLIVVVYCFTVAAVARNEHMKQVERREADASLRRSIKNVEETVKRIERQLVPAEFPVDRLKK